MAQEIQGEVDLFGFPVIHRSAQRGRPEHVRTAENANKVSLLFAMGKSVADVARAIGISQPTLRLHYFSEVEQRDTMLLRLEANELDRLFKASGDGNVSATKELLARVDKARIGFVTPQSKKPKRAKLGKKEQRLEEARYAGAGDEDWDGLLNRTSTH